MMINRFKQIPSTIIASKLFAKTVFNEIGRIKAKGIVQTPESNIMTSFSISKLLVLKGLKLRRKQILKTDR